MKKILTFVASLVLAGAAQAGSIGFENVATGGDFASLSDLNPYAGLNWSDGWFAGDTSIDGYANGAHSGSNFAVNGFGENLMSVSSASGFNFAGAWFATPAGVVEKAGWINISAYDAASHLIGSTGNIAIGDDYRWLSAGFSNVALLNITSDSGWYAMDDFTTSAGAAVPEPGTTLLLALGLVTLMAGRRRSAS